MALVDALHARWSRSFPACGLAILLGAFSAAAPSALAQLHDSSQVAPSDGSSWGHCTVEHGSRLRGTVEPTKLWPGGIVPYTFDAGVAAGDQTFFINVLTTLQGICNVQFITRTTETDYVIVKQSAEAGGNNSKVGKVGGAQDINIWNWDNERIVIHEVMHALGMYHEQSRNDRDSYVRINYENIDDDKEGNFTLASGSSTFAPYDFASVMHYPDTNFNVNGNRTLNLISGLAREWQDVVGRTETPSSSDRRTLVSLYGGLPLPAPFGLILPSTGALVGLNWSPSFAWTASGMATSYRLLVDDDPDFSSPAIDVNIVATSYAAGVALPNRTLYYWTVIAENAEGETSPWPVPRAAFYTGANVPNILYIDDNGSPGNTGASWASARSDLFHATAMARWLPGHIAEIRVAQGVYTPDSGTGDRLRAFELADGVALRGGFAGQGATDPDERDTVSYPTVLSGDLNGDDAPALFQNYGDNSYHVVSARFVTDAELSGVIIQGGNADRADRTFRTPDADTGGGGLLVDGSRVLVENCRFEHNIADTRGGGALITDDRGSTISRCRFNHNRAMTASATYGGGLSVMRGGDALITGCRFESNEAMYGGALDVQDGGSAAVVNSVFTGNRATLVSGTTGSGGAVSSGNGATPLIANSTFVANTADTAGGGIAALGGAAVEVRNCILWNDTSQNGAELAAALSNASLTVSHSDVEGGAGAAFLSSGLLTQGAGNIDVDPMFVDLNGHDFRLSMGSPCIDAGDSTVLPTEVLTDFAGGVRVVDHPAAADTGIGDFDGRVVDMGAFESLSHDCNANSLLDVNEITADPGLDCNSDGLLDSCQTFGPLPGMALHFDGADQVEVADDADLQFFDGESITIEAWVRVDQFEAPPNDTAERRIILTKGPWKKENYFLQLESDGALRFGYRDQFNSADYYYTTSAPALSIDGAWRHIAVRHIFGENSINIYIDGVEAAGTWGTSPATGPMDSTDAELTIGAQSKSPDYHRRFVGAIDDVRLWRTFRSPAQIDQNKYRHLTGGEPGLVAYWDFDDGAGNKVTDLTGGHDGLRLSPRWIPRIGCVYAADFDFDGDVDLDDYPRFASCFAGPDVSVPPPGCPLERFTITDLDHDNDVDLGDFDMFMRAISP
ncbi:MAG TPA: M12 family metallopeptidase [Phycisphaerae bacterium]|nr:M12 family metallopeptidase [Phycisphaerae bacterium]